MKQTRHSHQNSHNTTSYPNPCKSTWENGMREKEVERLTKSTPRYLGLSYFILPASPKNIFFKISRLGHNPKQEIYMAVIYMAYRKTTTVILELDCQITPWASLRCSEQIDAEIHSHSASIHVVVEARYCHKSSNLMIALHIGSLLGVIPSLATFCRRECLLYISKVTSLDESATPHGYVELLMFNFG